MSWRESELEFEGESGVGPVELAFYHAGVFRPLVCRVMKAAGEAWEEEDCAPLSGPARWLYGVIFGMKSLEPIFALRSTVGNKDVICFHRCRNRRGVEKVLVLAHDSGGDGGGEFTIPAEKFRELRGRLATWRRSHAQAHAQAHAHAHAQARAADP